ncbi:hypothetical protein LUZ60_006392 [Juncus effusus]|nr:hypothetical protein LUZ60_006392 [Juncus effusus]
MHRDIKPQNFLFGRDDVLKAIDFGMAIFFKPGQRFRESVGTPAYMAPEIFLHNYGPKADIWSAGFILYQLLCGRKPFIAGGNRELLKEKIFRSEINFSSHPWPTVSEGAKALVKSAITISA